MKRIWLAVAGLVLAAGIVGVSFAQDARQAAMARLKKYDTPFYTIYSDAAQDKIREMSLRLASLYGVMDADLGVQSRPTGAMPVYFFSRKEDCEAAGGVSGSVWTGRADTLMTCEVNGKMDWHSLQRRAFGQYREDRKPVMLYWMDRGMEDYYGDAVWTGDGCVTGVLDFKRVQRVQKAIADKKLEPWSDVMDPRGAKFISDSQLFSDQRWAMIQYLSHGENGKHGEEFRRFLQALPRAKWQQAWVASFGPDIQGMEKSCWAWWAALSEQSTKDMYQEATVQTLTSYLARAESMGQKFADVGEFFAAGHKEKGLKYKEPQQWLPPTLLEQALKDAEKLSEWSLEKGKNGSELVLKTKERMSYRGKFELAKDGKILDVWVDIGDKGAAEVSRKNKKK